MKCEGCRSRNGTELSERLDAVGSTDVPPEPRSEALIVESGMLKCGSSSSEPPFIEVMIFILSVDSTGPVLVDLGPSWSPFVAARFPDFLAADFFSFPFCKASLRASGSSFSSRATLGAIGLSGPKGLGAEYFLGPLGPRLSGLSAVFDALSFESAPSTRCAIEETLSSA